MRCQVVTDRLLDSAAAHVELARFAFLPHTEVLTASPTSAREFDRWAVRGPGTLSRQRGELDSSLGHFVQQARKERGALVPPMSEELGGTGFHSARDGTLFFKNGVIISPDARRALDYSATSVDFDDNYPRRYAVVVWHDDRGGIAAV